MNWLAGPHAFTTSKETEAVGQNVSSFLSGIGGVSNNLSPLPVDHGYEVFIANPLDLSKTATIKSSWTRGLAVNPVGTQF